MSALFTALTVPLDTSKQAAHAVDLAVAWARGGKTVLHFCSVVDPAGIASPSATGAMVDPQPMVEALEANARRVTGAAMAKARAAQVSADAAVLFGPAAETIAQSAREGGSDGIFICTHARTGFVRFLAGSVTEELLTLATLPVIVVHHDDVLPAAGSIAVAIDGSPSANAAVETAIWLAAANQRSLAFLHVVQPGELGPDAARILAAAADRVRATGLAFELVTLHGSAAATIVENAEQRGSAVIVAGTRGLAGIGRAVLGSVAAAIIERVRMPVVVVRAP